MTLLGREECGIFGSQTEGAIGIYSAPGSETNQLIYYTGSGGAVSLVIPPTNQWCQVAVTIDQSGSLSFYFNGTNVPVTLSGSGNSGQPLNFWIGSSDSGGCGGSGRYVWNGLIDDIRIYDVPLSATNVQELYQLESMAESPCFTHPASAIATQSNGFVINVTLTDNGCGYTNTPLVGFEGGGGSGVIATAVVSNGAVIGINLSGAGSNYTSTPTVEIGGPPVIVTEPQPETVYAHGSATFSVAAGGTTFLNYQWSFNGTNIPGATASFLTITNIAQTNLGTYDVAISNVFGATNSSDTILSMYPYLVTPFAGLDTYWGYTNTLSVTTWGSGPLSYQWFNNGAAITNATNSTLTFTGIQPANAGLYTVVVTDPYGSVTNTPEQVVVAPAGVAFGGLYPSVLINGVAGYTYTIQSTTNLANTNAWVTVTNLTLTEPIQLFVDTNIDASLPQNPHRFYQVLPGR